MGPYRTTLFQNYTYTNSSSFYIWYTISLYTYILCPTDQLAGAVADTSVPKLWNDTMTFSSQNSKLGIKNGYRAN